MKEGRIVALTCGIYSVLAEGTIFRLPARGIFRKNHEKPMVGDLVTLDEERQVITEIKPRVSFLKRPPVTNIDRMLLVMSLAEPEFSYLLTFKYLTYANQNGVKAEIILTKPDRLKEKGLLTEIRSVFDLVGVPIHVINNKTREGVMEIRPLFPDHVTCLIGQTGAGKSSLLNAVNPEYERETGEYSRALGRGKHKTKEVVLLPYEGGFIADTPGFSSLDLDLSKEDLAAYFPQFPSLYTDCYFSDCLHQSESRCAVKKAVEEGKIPQIAYECYLKLSSEAFPANTRYDK